MRFTIAEQALAGPAFAEAEIAAAAATGGNHDAVGTTAQRIFDESRRQHAGADQLNHRGVGAGQRAALGTARAGEDDDAGAAGELRQRLVDPVATLFDDRRPLAALVALLDGLR